MIPVRLFLPWAVAFFLLFSPIAQHKAVSQTSAERCATAGNPRFHTDLSQFGGIYLPSVGTLRILLVFVTYSNDNNYMYWWPAHNPPTNMSSFIDPSASTGSTNFANLTNYFTQMSGSLFHVIGDAVFVQTPHDSLWYASHGYGRAQINADVLQNAVDPLVSFAAYDNWKYIQDYQQQNVPDGIVDMVVMVWRGLQFGILGEASLGYGSDITLDGKTIKFGYGGGQGSGVTSSYKYSHAPEKVLQTMAHEISHWLLGPNHPYSLSVASPVVWSVLGNQAACGVCANSYERERLAWISCVPVTDVNSQLGDYLTSGVAYKFHPSNGDPNEYFYIENHQKLSIYDDASSNPNDKGLYVIHQDDVYSNTSNIRITSQDGNWNWLNPNWTTACFPPNYLPDFQKGTVNRGVGGCSFRDALLASDGNKHLMFAYLDRYGNQLCNAFLKGDYFFQGFNPTLNGVLSPWSNPNTNTWSNNATTFALQALTQNGSTITVHFYTTNPQNVGPSRPTGMQIGPNPGNRLVLVSWTANVESNIWYYEVWRNAQEADGSTWYLIATPTGTSFVDAEYLYTYPVGDFHLSYSIRAVDTRPLVSNFSDTVTTRGEYTHKKAPGPKLAVTSYGVSPNFPNPFNPSTKINFSLPAPSRVRLVIYDMLGREVSTVTNRDYPAGNHKVAWLASDYASGVYYARIIVTDNEGWQKFSKTTKIVLAK